MWRKQIVVAAIFIAAVLPLKAFASYDLILEGINDYNTAMSYSNKTILVASGAFVRYPDLTLENCTLDIDGSGECVSALTLDNSVIKIRGNFRIQPGAVINETGASSIRASSNASYTGKLTIEEIPGI